MSHSPAPYFLSLVTFSGRVVSTFLFISSPWGSLLGSTFPSSSILYLCTITSATLRSVPKYKKFYKKLAIFPHHFLHTKPRSIGFNRSFGKIGKFIYTIKLFAHMYRCVTSYFVFMNTCYKIVAFLLIYIVFNY